MSVKSRNSLKAEFVAGTAANSDKFNDIMDSHYNVYEDSVLLGPSGMTGQYGILGPEGPTVYLGLWLDQTGATPSGSTATGATGQVIIDGTDLYICQ